MRTFSVLFTASVFVCMLSAPGVQAQHVTKFPASYLVTNGESFFAAGNITTELTRLARADGYIGSNESFKSVSVSGVPLATIVNQYKNCTPKPKYLVSDGAGIDLMSSNNIQGLSTTLKQYLDEMKKGGTKKLLWMIYPDPQGSQWATLKTNQDLWAAAVPPIINACKDPKTLLIDLRPVWAGHYSAYTTDGIHCTDAGGTATATAFWKIMKDSNFFDTGSAVSVKQPLTIGKMMPSTFLGQHVTNNTVYVSLSLAQPAAVNIRITTLLGRTLITANKQSQGQGLQTIQFPLTAITSGTYFLEVRAGQLTNHSVVLVP